METKELKTDNRPFRDAIIGVLLVIASLAVAFFSKEYGANAPQLQTSIIAVLAGMGGYTLIKVMKKDKERLSKYDNLA